MERKNLIVIEHPLVKVYLTKIRDKQATHFEFKQYVDKLSMLLAYEASKELQVKPRKIKTPLAPYTGSDIKGEVILMPILRAGLGLINGFTNLFPAARVSHLGVFRDEKTLLPVRYYFKFPKIEKGKSNAIIFILDPMLATGGSMCAAIDEAKKTGIKRIVSACLVAAPEGVKEVHKYHSDIKIFTCALDKKLNKLGYIVPGLGDAGDRLFGTI